MEGISRLRLSLLLRAGGAESAGVQPFEKAGDQDLLRDRGSTAQRSLSILARDPVAVYGTINGFIIANNVATSLSISGHVTVSYHAREPGQDHVYAAQLHL